MDFSATKLIKNDITDKQDRLRSSLVREIGSGRQFSIGGVVP